MQQTPSCWTPWCQERLSGQTLPHHLFLPQMGPSWRPLRLMTMLQATLVGCCHPCSAQRMYTQPNPVSSVKVLVYADNCAQVS